MERESEISKSLKLNIKELGLPINLIVYILQSWYWYDTSKVCELDSFTIKELDNQNPSTNRFKKKEKKLKMGPILTWFYLIDHYSFGNTY